MSTMLLSGPAVEPLTLAEAKVFLRVETADEDDIIAALIAGARIHVEVATRRALIEQSWRMVRDAWPKDGMIAVDPAPLRSLSAARVYGGDGVARAVDLQAFVVDGAGARIWFAPWALPARGRPVGGIEIDFSAGYGAAASDVPEPLGQAIRLLVAHWYETRAIAVAGPTKSDYSQGIAALLAPYRVLPL